MLNRVNFSTQNYLNTKVGFGANFSATNIRLSDDIVEKLHDDRIITVGRSDDSQVTLYSSRASRNHLTLQLRDGKYIVRDHSSNGTTVVLVGKKDDTEKLIHNKTEIVPPGSLLIMGQDTLELPEIG